MPSRGRILRVEDKVDSAHGFARRPILAMSAHVVRGDRVHRHVSGDRHFQKRIDLHSMRIESCVRSIGCG